MNNVLASLIGNAPILVLYGSLTTAGFVLAQAVFVDKALRRRRPPPKRSRWN